MDDKTVDPHHYLLGRERVLADDKEVLGRREGDSEHLFPRHTHAEVCVTSTLEVNGKTLNVWTYAQLETLSQAVLRQRAKVIRDAVGDSTCPPLPSGQPGDLIRWILHMQSQLMQEDKSQGKIEMGGRASQLSSGHLVPKAVALEQQQRPIGAGPLENSKERNLPFGPRTVKSHDAGRDHFGEMLDGKGEAEEMLAGRGIVSQRIGGEGRKHLNPADNMLFCGVSGADQQGIQSLRSGGEGRRLITCKDNLMEQKRELQGVGQGKSPANLSGNRSGQGRHHVSESAMLQQGVSAALEDQLLGDRRRHSEVPDRLINAGTSDPGNADPKGRRRLDSFHSPKFTCQSQQQDYQSCWRKNPSKLKGQSMLI